MGSGPQRPQLHIKALNPKAFQPRPMNARRSAGSAPVVSKQSAACQCRHDLGAVRL